MKWEVTVVYDLTGELDTNLDKLIRKEAKNMNGTSIGSGAGFGQRDHEFEFPDRKYAISFVNSLIDNELLGFSLHRALTKEEIANL